MPGGRGADGRNGRTSTRADATGVSSDTPDPQPRGRALPKTRATPGLSCDLCGGPVLDRHCKVVCLNCGYQRDCSDP